MPCRGARYRGTARAPAAPAPRAPWSLEPPIAVRLATRLSRLLSGDVPGSLLPRGQRRLGLSDKRDVLTRVRVRAAEGEDAFVTDDSRLIRFAATDRHPPVF